MSKQQNTSPVVVAISSDHHCESTVGLCPYRVPLDDGGEYKASKGQRWLYRNWKEYTVRVKAKASHLGAPIISIFNGDITEGDHHRSTQAISKNPATQAKIAYEVLQPLIDVSEVVYVIRGTEAHVGPSASHEEQIANDWTNVMRDPDTDTATSFHRLLDINGTIIDIGHHGSLGQLPWTQANGVNKIAAKILYAAGRRGFKPPHLVIRSHLHRYADSYNNHRPLRVIALPGWQLPSAYVHKVDVGQLGEFGGLILTCWPGDGVYDAEMVLFEPNPKRPEKVTL